MTSTRTICRTCGFPEYAKGMCRSHYNRSRPKSPPCKLDGCEYPKSFSDGLCQTHGRRLRSTGTTEPPTYTCGVEGCQSERTKRAYLCPTHAALKSRTGTTDPDVGYSPDLIAEYERTVPRGEPDACWEWPGRRQQVESSGKGGYGLVRGRYAHRIAYQSAHGVIPAGLFVLHSCDNPPCVNPAHLRTGTNSDNMRDAVQRGRHWTPSRRTQ